HGSAAAIISLNKLVASVTNLMSVRLSQRQAGAADAWICCQIGARQHYSVPFSLHNLGHLDCLITDIWFEPNSLPATLNRNLAGRFHPGFQDITVYALNRKAIAFEAVAFLRRLHGWRLIEKR